MKEGSSFGRPWVSSPLVWSPSSCLRYWVEPLCGHDTEWDSIPDHTISGDQTKTTHSSRPGWASLTSESTLRAPFFRSSHAHLEEGPRLPHNQISLSVVSLTRSCKFGRAPVSEETADIRLIGGQARGPPRPAWASSRLSTCNVGT